MDKGKKWGVWGYVGEDEENRIMFKRWEFQDGVRRMGKWERSYEDYVKSKRPVCLGPRNIVRGLYQRSMLRVRVGWWVEWKKKRLIVRWLM